MYVCVTYFFDSHKVNHSLWFTMLVEKPHQWLSIQTFVCLFVYLAVDLAVNRIQMSERDCEFEILDESDVLLFAVRNETKQKKKSTVHEVLKTISTFRESFSSLWIKARSSVSLISNHIQTSLQLFSLFISFDMRCIIVKNTKQNAIIKQKQEKVKKQELKHCQAWRSTNDHKVRTFMKILLYMSLYHCSKYENYWNTQSNKSVFIEIIQAMSKKRFCQILRYWKIFDSDENLNSKESDFWKKLESLVSDIWKTSCQYWKSDRNVSVDEQLILFRERFKHIMMLSTKAAEMSFKIYSLCQENYILDFLFTSKICLSSDFCM